MRSDLATLFNELADMPPRLRSQYLNDCEVDADTRRELEELLAHDDGSDETISCLVGAAAKAALHGDSRGLRCGAFRLVSVLGTGGMGVVYLAQRADGEVTQRAAVKLMQPGWSPEQRERFLREREILAALTHPTIAHLLDAGHLKDGQPYLAMEFVEGKRIDEYCRGLSARHKIELFLKVCNAVEYLHANFVLHRDLKPSNILVTAMGEPKLLDFGIAKIVDLQAQITVTQVRMLTPDYASPEQLNGGTVGPVSDVYSLGAVLHCLLLGKPANGTRQDVLPTDIEGDVQYVLQTAMQADPQDRYATVAEFSDDLRACLESRPVRARRRHWPYRIRKFVRRQRVSVALGGALLLALGGVAALWRHRLGSPAGGQDLRLERLTSNTPDLPIEAAAISPDGKIVAHSDSLGVHLHYRSTGETRLIQGTSGHVLQHWNSDSSSLRTQTLDGNGKIATALVKLDGSVQPTGTVGQVSFKPSPDGRLGAYIAVDPQRLMVTDANGGNARELWMAQNRSVTDFNWSPDGGSIAVASYATGGSLLESIRVADGTRQVLVSAERKMIIGSVAWLRSGRLVAAVHDQARGVNSVGSSNLWEIRPQGTGPAELRRLTTWTDFPIRLASLTTDGAQLAFIRSFRQRDVYVADLDLARGSMTTPRRLTLDLGDDYPTSWTPDSKAVVFTSDRNGPSAIFRQDLDQQIAKQLVFGPTSQIIARAAARGKWILFYGRDGAKRGVMRASMDGGSAELLFEVSGIMGLRCSRVGPCIVSERQNGVVVVSEFDPVKGSKGREIYRDATVRFTGPDLSPDAKWLATPSGGKIIFRSFATGAIVREVEVAGATNAMKVLNLDYAADGKGFFAGQTTPTETRLLYIDLAGKASLLWRQAGTSSVWAVPSPDGRRVAMMVYTDDSNVYTAGEF
ncbi:MAG TPA: protein kinase [Bryobacteraceae bacterium]|nr:protein kinase [Bryobacteraceae bacterium]